MFCFVSPHVVVCGLWTLSYVTLSLTMNAILNLIALIAAHLHPKMILEVRVYSVRRYLYSPFPPPHPPLSTHTLPGISVLIAVTITITIYFVHPSGN